MSTFLLIHGAWHGAWCWENIKPQLEEAGHRVLTPDLPGHGSDKTPVSEVTLKAYTDKVCSILDSETEPVILVGHSMGGIVITQAAEYRPEKIKQLVYVTGFLLGNGEILMQYAEPDQDAMVVPNLVMSEDKASAVVENSVLRETFYGSCSDSDYEKAKDRLVPQSGQPFVTPIEVTAGNFGRLKKSYITCLKDKAISPAYQEKMFISSPCDHVIEMDTDHSPFYSAPKDLVRHLLWLDQ